MDENNQVNEPLASYEQPATFEQVWKMFQKQLFHTQFKRF